MVGTEDHMNDWKYQGLSTLGKMGQEIDVTIE
jgi:hypothetical protein